MAEPTVIIIRKKKGGGHAGAHGGAWKVAYADFVTAMMCFFLVMWLMGSDEEIQSAVAHYFNHPNTPYKAGADQDSKQVHPLGEKAGAGDDVLNGLNGMFPEDQIERARPIRDVTEEARTISKLVEDLLDGRIYGLDKESDYVRFSMPDTILFERGSAELSKESKESLDLVGRVLKRFKGQVTIAGHTDEKPRKGERFQNNWELSFARALNVMRYLVKQHKLDESKLVPMGQGDRYPLADPIDPKAATKNRRVEFTLGYEDT